MGSFSAKSLNFLKDFAKEGKVEVKQLYASTPKSQIAATPVGSIFLFKYVLIQVKVTSKKGFDYWITGRRDSKKHKNKKYKNSPKKKPGKKKPEKSVARRVRHLEVLAMLVEPITLVSPLGNTLFSCVKLNPIQLTSLGDIDTLYNTGSRIKDTYRTFRLGSMYNILQISNPKTPENMKKELSEGNKNE